MVDEELLRDPDTAAAACKALARICRDEEGRKIACCHLEPLVGALCVLGPADPAVARHGCTALVGVCRSCADDQARAAALGAFTAAAVCVRAHPQLLPQASAAVEALCTGKGAAGRREDALGAGWLQILVSACSAAASGAEEGSERPQALARAALRSITRDSMRLQQAALDAGAAREWLL